MKKDKIWGIILVVYVFLLILFVVIKFDGSINSISDRIDSIKESRSEGFWNYNLVLFRSISHYLLHITSSHGYMNIIGNIVPFIPLGFLIPMNFNKYRTLVKTVFVSFISIIGVELFQFCTMLGHFDIDDILLNTIGSLIGYFIFVTVAYSGTSGHFAG